MSRITERTLRKWRREALVVREDLGRDPNRLHDAMKYLAHTFAGRVLSLTQELLDQALLKGGKNDREDTHNRKNLVSL